MSEIPKRRLIDQIGDAPTFVAEGSRLTGDLETPGPLVMCGVVRGDGRIGGALRMSVTAEWHGEIHALAAVIAGRISGRLVVENKLEVGATAVIQADIVARSIAVAKGAIIDGVVLGFDAASGLTKVRVGHGDLYVQAKDRAAGTPLRVQLLARDVIVSTQIPERLSVRNCLAGVVTGIQDDDLDSDLVTIDIGGALIVARITKAATRALSLTPQMNTWALVKSVSLRGHAFAVPAPAITSAASPNA